MLANADLALRQTKAAGKEGCQVFDAWMREQYDARRASEEEVCLAALGGQIVLHYRSQVRLSDRAVVGPKTLLR